MNKLYFSIPLFIAASATAQLTIVPSAAATVKPDPLAWNSNVFYSTSSTTTPHDSHAQLIYDCSDIAAPGAVWTSLEVRRPVGLGNSNPAMTTNATIVMSVSSNPSTAASTTFANNHGAQTSTVFQGQISLPPSSNQASWPAPWQPPIVFQQPFGYLGVAGGSLVIDIMQTGNSATTTWYLEATGRDVGTRTSNPNAQSSCRFSNGNYNNSLSYTSPYVGSSWFVSYGSILPNASGVAGFGFTGVGGTWGGVSLPFDLTPLGAPGCSWNIDPVLTIPIVASATGSARWPTLAIPANPAIAGSNFYDHALFFDPAANAAGVVTTWSSRWTIGSGIGAPGATVYATGSSAANATGILSAQNVPTFQLQ